MAIYHLTANIISRSRGQSVVAAAAYRLGAALRDERYGVTHRYQGKRGVVHSEIMAPAGTPAWVRDREVLWNRVESCECRKDSQLARVIEVGLPVELSAAERVALLRDYVASEFVARGMIADFCIRGAAGNPHAQMLLTLRGVTPAGFGPKERRWNGKGALLEWRCAWAAHVNQHLARAGHTARIDHRTLEAQQIELTPGRRIGVGRARREQATLPDHFAGRIAEQRRIAAQNGETILQDPTVALRALAHQRSTFTEQDLAQFLRHRTGDAAQFDAALAAVRGCADLVALAALDGQVCFTSRDLVEAGKSLMRRVRSLAARRGHGIPGECRAAAIEAHRLNEAERLLFDYIVAEGDAKAAALAEASKARVLAAARQAWAATGLTVFEALAPKLAAWEAGRSEQDLTRVAVLLVEGAEMLGVKQLERVVAFADRSRAKVVLMADADRLREIQAESSFRDVARLIGLGAEVLHEC